MWCLEKVDDRGLFAAPRLQMLFNWHFCVLTQMSHIVKKSGLPQPNKYAFCLNCAYETLVRYMGVVPK